MKIAVLFISFFVLCACGGSTDTTPKAEPQSAATQRSSETADLSSKAPDPQLSSERSTNEPRTVIDFFNLLPEKYFTLEGCDKPTDKDCKNARAEYLKNFSEVSDVGNGYFKGGCDGAQSCIEMAIFKRPDGTYLAGVATEFEMGNNFYFLDYAGGAWNDVSATVVPDYSKKNWYELPRVGTTMKVYAKKITEQGADYEVSEKGNLLYSLVWKDEKFAKLK